MPRTFVNTLQGAFERNCSMVLQSLELCPDELWTANAGGFPFWQQTLHVFASTAFFVNDKNDWPYHGGPLDPGLSDLKQPPSETVSKDQVREAAQHFMALVGRYFDSLIDARLSHQHEGLSERLTKLRGEPVSFNHLAVINALSGHFMYHLGVNDAAFRDHGLKGIF